MSTYPTLLVVLGLWTAPKQAARTPIDWGEVRAALWDAKWELALPVFTFPSLLSGWATPSETAALTAAYALVVEGLVYLDLSWKNDVPRVMVECGVLVGGIILILGMASAFTNYIADAQVPDHAAEWVSASIHSRWVFLLALNGLLLVVGMVMDIFSAVIVLTPLILSTATSN